MRQTYENVHTIADEVGVIEQIADAWCSSYRKLPKSYRIDWMMERGGEPKAWVEVKCRNRQYDTFFIALGKYMEGVRLARETSLPFIIAVRWPEGIFWHKVDGAPPVIRWGGRNDRGDDADEEPMVHIPTARFRGLTA